MGTTPVQEAASPPLPGELHDTGVVAAHTSPQPNGGNCIIRGVTRRRHADSQLLMLQNPQHWHRDHQRFARSNLIGCTPHPGTHFRRYGDTQGPTSLPTGDGEHCYTKVACNSPTARIDTSSKTAEYQRLDPKPRHSLTGIACEITEHRVVRVGPQGWEGPDGHGWWQDADNWTHGRRHGNTTLPHQEPHCATAGIKLAQHESHSPTPGIKLAQHTPPRHMRGTKLALLARNGPFWRVFRMHGELCTVFAANEPHRANFIPHARQRWG